MGKGRFIGNELDLYVALDFDASQVTGQIEDIFLRLSDRFHQATDGQLSIASIFWIDNSLGRNVADIFFRQDPSGILGQAVPDGLGDYGTWMEVFDVGGFNPSKNDELAFATMHELGHYAWDLGDEYAGPTLTGPLDPTEQQGYDDANAAPYRYVYLAADFDTLNPATDEDYDLTDSEVSVFLNGVWETGFAASAIEQPGGVIELFVQYGTGFSAPPSSSLQDVRVRPFGVCGAQSADFCVMNGRGGEVNRREFCGEDNHEPNRLTGQSYRHIGLDCWQVIANRMAAEPWNVTVTAPSVGVPSTGAAPPPSLIKLQSESRFVLVLDRSGSMAENDKIEGARAGLESWIDFAEVENDRIGIVWFNSAIEPVQTLENFGSISDPDLETVKDNVLSLPPEGATNIKDALDQAADMLIADALARGPAMQQCIVLLTDGVHNVPPPSEMALDAVRKCQENGIQIFTLGLGEKIETNGSSNIDATVLEQLAERTSGRALMGAINFAGEEQDREVFELLYTLRQELWGDVAADFKLEFDELSGGSKLDEPIRKWRQERERPPLEKLMDAAGAASLQDMLKDKARFASSSMWVEKGAEGSSFVISFPRKQPVWLYLIDPDGNDLSEAEMKPFRGRYPYEGSVINDPKRGRWTVVAVRLESGPAFRARFIGGIENRRLIVAGDCDKVVPLGSGGRIWARAYWDGDLSGIHVRARLRDPQGGMHTVVLSDETADDPFSGAYQGMFTPTIQGRYHGEIMIAGKEDVLLGGGIEALAHMSQEAKKEGTKLDLRRQRDPFARRIKIYFDAGERRPPKDREKAKGIWAKDRSRRRRLVTKAIAAS